MDSSKRRTVLLSAFACDPVTGSEPYVGWQWTKMLSENGNDLHVLTRSANKPLIAGSEMEKVVQFHYFELPLCDRIDHRSRIMKTYYSIWQLFAVFFVMKLNRIHKFDIIHHITYNVIDMPGFLWLVRGSKFVWGPVGGGQVPPAQLKQLYGRSGWAKQMIRSLSKRFARYNPLIRSAVSNAAYVLCANEETLARMPPIRGGSSLMLETAIGSRGEQAARTYPTDEVKTLLWLGRVEPRKALPLALDAMAEVKRRSPELICLKVVGDGPTLADAKRHAEALGLLDRVEFLGSVPHEQVMRFMETALVFLFTSVQDTSGNVVLEAMSAGTPSISLNHQGAKWILRDGGGLLVDITDYDGTVSRYADAILTLSNDGALWEKLSSEASQIASDQHSWPKKSHEIETIYSQIV